MHQRVLWTAGGLVVGMLVGSAGLGRAGQSQDLRAAFRVLDELSTRHLKMGIEPIEDARRDIVGARTSVTAGARAGLIYVHDVNIGASVPGDPDNVLLEVETVPGDPDHSVGSTVPGNPDSVHTSYFASSAVGNPDLLTQFSFGTTRTQSPWLLVETVPGNPDFTLHFAIGNPDLFPAGTVHLDLGAGNSFDLVRSTSGATMIEVPTR